MVHILFRKLDRVRADFTITEFISILRVLHFGIIIINGILEFNHAARLHCTIVGVVSLFHVV